MNLYHITINTNSPTIKTFTPQIPENKGQDENGTIPRICLSDSIEGCIQAMPKCSDALSTNKIIRIYKCNTQDIKQSHLIHPLQLYLSNLVPDALENHEYWYLRDIVMTSKLYKVIDFDYCFEIAWTCVKATDIIKIAEDIIGHQISIEYNEYDQYKLYNDILEKYRYECPEIEDDLWDEVACLPWAKLIKVASVNIQQD